MGETIESQATAWIAVIAVACLGIVAVCFGYDSGIATAAIAVLGALGGAKIATRKDPL